MAFGGLGGVLDLTDLRALGLVRDVLDNPDRWQKALTASLPTRVTR